MLVVSFIPFPELQTERLLLRRFTTEDTPEMFLLRSDKAIIQYLSKGPAKSLKEAEDFIISINTNIDNNESVLWAIVLKENPAKAIGNICYWQLSKEHYRAELGYVLAPAYWRKGIMKEALLKVIEYGFTGMGLHSIEARVNPANIASAALLEATGFVREGYFKEDFFHGGKFEDTAVYSRLQ